MLAGVHGEQDHGGFGSDGSDLPSRVESIHNWHRQVEDHDVRVQGFDLFDGDRPIFCFTANLPTIASLEPRSERPANWRAVVDDQDCSGHSGGTKITPGAIWPDQA